MRTNVHPHFVLILCKNMLTRRIFNNYLTIPHIDISFSI
nr:MAG TPA: hypothetical protein [Caudoviricetes sp.]